MNVRSLRSILGLADFGSALVVVLVACTIATLWVFVDAGVDRTQKLDRRNALDNAVQIAELFEGEIARSIDVSVAALDRAADAIGQPDQFDHFRKVLLDAEAAHPEITSVAVLDATGRGRVTTTTGVRDYDGRSHEAFVRHGTDPARTVHISLPFEGSGSGLRRVLVSRRIDAADGGFAGVVGVTLRYEYFDAMLARARQGPNGTVGLHRNDKMLMARVPNALGLIGKSSANADVWYHYPDREFGIVDIRSSVFDGIPRVVAFRKVRDYPLVVTVTLAVGDLAARQAEIASLPNRAAVAASLALVAIGIVGVFAMRKLHRMRQDALVQRRIAESDRVAAEAARAKAQQEHTRAELASRAKTRFLANMSHELRTPLNAIIGFAETIRGAYVEPVGPRTREYAGHVYDSGQHLLSLVDDLLDLTQIEIAEKKLELEPLDVRAIADVAATRMSFQYAQRRIALDVVGTAGAPVPLNRRALLQILLNLLSNAARFAPADGHVEIAIAQTASGVEIRVADDGPGMPPDMIARIGELFLQNDNPLTTGKAGTGLGLAIVKALVEKQNGTLLVRNRPIVGSEFVLHFPFATAAGAAANADRPGPAQIAS